ncbi:MAG: DNA repair exonuclease [Candidatus Micrarchaeaceae archaeon]
MKLGIVSDLHLGYERFRADAYRQAREALLAAASTADALLVPGDIFDVRTPRPDVIAEAFGIFRELSSMNWRARTTELKGAGKAYTQVPILIISGTHERRAAGEENPVSLLNLAGFAIDVSDAVAVLELGDEKVAVRGIGGVSEDRFRDYLRSADIKPLEGMFNVLMMHQSVYELMPFNSDFVHFDELPEGFDLYIDGHIHSRVESKAHGKPFIIPGSTVLTQLKETEQESKGFAVFDTKTGKPEFKEINSRRFVVAKVDVSGKEPGEIEKEAEEGITRASSKGGMPVVLVQLYGSLKPGLKLGDIDLAGLPKKFEGKAIVELGGSGVEEVGIIAGEFKQGMLNGASVKDLGTSIFVEKLKSAGYSLEVPPTVLFELLSGDNKEKAVKAAADKLLGKE